MTNNFWDGRRLLRKILFWKYNFSPRCLPPRLIKISPSSSRYILAHSARLTVESFSCQARRQCCDGHCGDWRGEPQIIWRTRDAFKWNRETPDTKGFKIDMKQVKRKEIREKWRSGLEDHLNDLIRPRLEEKTTTFTVEHQSLLWYQTYLCYRL